MVQCVLLVIYFLLQLTDLYAQETEIIDNVFDPVVALPGQKLCITPGYTITPGYYLRYLYFQAQESKQYHINICLFTKDNWDGSTQSQCFKDTQWYSRIFIPDSEISNTVCFSPAHQNDNFFKFRWHLTAYNNNNKYDRRITEISFALDIKTAENIETHVLNCSVLHIQVKKKLSNIEKLYIYREKTKHEKELIYLWKTKDKLPTSFHNQSLIDTSSSNSSHIRLISQEHDVKHTLEIVAEGKDYMEHVIRNITFSKECYFIGDVQESNTNTKDTLLKLAGTAIIALIVVIILIILFVCCNCQEKCKNRIQNTSFCVPQCQVNNRSQKFRSVLQKSEISIENEQEASSRLISVPLKSHDCKENYQKTSYNLGKSHGELNDYVQCPTPTGRPPILRSQSVN